MKQHVKLSGLLTLVGTALVMAGCGSNSADSGGGGPTVVGSGKIATESREIPNFTDLESSGSIVVRYHTGKTSKLTVQTDDNIQPLIKTKSSGNTLKIWSDQSFSSNSGVIVDVTNPQLSSIEQSGSGKCSAEGLEGETLRVVSAGSGDITASGAVKSLDSIISGAGTLNLEALQATDAHVRVTGSASVTVNATSLLDASITGSGSIKYKGSAKVTEHVIGSGVIKPL